MHYVRGTIDAPSFASLGEGLQTELSAASAALRGLPPVAPAMVDKAPDACFAALRHELSGHYLALHGTSGRGPRSPAEVETLRRLEAGPMGLETASAVRFRVALRKLNRELTGSRSTWRDGVIRLAADRAGNHTVLPPVSAVPDQLERIRLVLEGAEAPSLFKAAIAHVLLLNCHPFTDGNGRVARVLFNHMLRQGGMPGDVYLPLYEIAGRAEGGYEITLRIAEIQGDWEPFLRYVLNAIRCCREIAATGAPSSASGLSAHG